MRAGHYLAIGLLMVGGCGQSSEAAPPKQQPKTQATASTRFDLAGVALGDSLASAKTALEQHGFRVEVFGGGWTFDDYVEDSRAKAQGRMGPTLFKGPSRLTARKVGETVYADVRASGDGPFIETVTYEAETNGRGPDELTAQVRARYPQGVVAAGGRRICSKADPNCSTRLPRDNYIQFEVATPFRIHLFAGSEQQLLWRAQLNGDLRKRLGPAPSSF